MQIRVGVIPGTASPVDLNEGASVLDALNEAGISLGGSQSVFVSGRKIANHLLATTTLNPGDSVGVAQEAKGNATAEEIAQFATQAAADHDRCQTQKATEGKKDMINMTVQQLTLVNGQDVTKMSADTLFNSLVEAKAQIKKLQDSGVAADFVAKKVEKLTAGVATLEAELNKREA